MNINGQPATKHRSSGPPSMSPSSSSDLYKFHRPKLRVHDTPHPLKRESELCACLQSVFQPNPNRSSVLLRCLRNLSRHRTKRPAPPYPRANCAAVLVALFVGRAGDLYVLLSQYDYLRRLARNRSGPDAMPTGEPRRSAPMLVIPHSQEEGSMMRTRLLKMPRCVQMSVCPLLPDCDS